MTLGEHPVKTTVRIQDGGIRRSQAQEPGIEPRPCWRHTHLKYSGSRGAHYLIGMNLSTPIQPTGIRSARLKNPRLSRRTRVRWLPIRKGSAPWVKYS